MPDIVPVVNAFKMNLRHGLIGARQRLVKRASDRSHTQDAPARGEEFTAPQR